MRCQTAAEIRADLQRLKRDTQSAVTLVPATRWRLAVPAAVVVLGCSAAAYFYLGRAPKLTEKDTLVLADFSNGTGDPLFDDTLRQGLSVELAQSPYLNLISDQQVNRTLALMGRPKNAALTPDVAQQICERTNSAAVLEGSIAPLGSRYVLGLRAKNCVTGELLDQEQAQAERKEEVLNSLSQMSKKFRTRVGESLATVEKHSTPLAEATTTSLEALKAYSTGIKKNVASGNAAGNPFFRRAVEIDPKFAMAYANLGLNYSTLGESVLSAESTTKAWQLRDRTSDREKFFITFTYYRQVTGDLEKAFQTLELWDQTYPRGPNPSAQGLLGGLSTHGTGRFEKVIQVATERIRIEPDVVFGYDSLASSLLETDRIDDADNALRRAAERKLETPNLLVMRYIIAFLKEDKAEMQGALDSARSRRGAEHWMTHSEALVLARSGQLTLARKSSFRAVELAKEEGQGETAATYLAASAVWESFYGSASEAKRKATDALALSHGRDVEYAAALALVVAGDIQPSQTLADDLEKRFPEDTFVRFTYVPILRAQLALNHGNPAAAVERLQSALHYELAVNGLSFNFYLGALYSAYLRGEAYLALHQPAEAAGEFRKLLNHRGLVFTDPLGAMARLQLARITKTKAAYEDLLTIWKDADPGIPVVKEARAEFAKL